MRRIGTVWNIVELVLMLFNYSLGNQKALNFLRLRAMHILVFTVFIF